MDPNRLAIERTARGASGPGSRRALITGGAGFLGVNAAQHLINDGWHVTILDNLSRTGTERNLRWLVYRYPHRVTFVKEDVRNAAGLGDHVRNQDAIVHLAGLVAVDPLNDFEVNARGTLNMLEAARESNREAPFLFASTGKVYGPLAGDHLPAGEQLALDPRGPYASSKAAADQYVRDYARTFQMQTVVLRMSAVYGAHQYGAEDEAWVARAVHAVLRDRPVEVPGNADRRHDLLDARDLSEAMALAIDEVDRSGGRVYNVGGGPGNAPTAADVMAMIGRLASKEPDVTFAGGEEWTYVSDVSQLERDLAWKPEIGLERGLADLIRWAESLD